MTRWLERWQVPIFIVVGLTVLFVLFVPRVNHSGSDEQHLLIYWIAAILIAAAVRWTMDAVLWSANR